ncbi:hypothetical protein QVD17_20407 [Tagetes erecta]|uniref:Uncharacterized protein n=1 Tax=Tagetes erecta TaxID=13708 RepID=A0AAD8KP32_TARER|nr:hypothetical protein QVD17_20407 [Tagetes erecta]
MAHMEALLDPTEAQMLTNPYPLCLSVLCCRHPPPLPLTGEHRCLCFSSPYHITPPSFSSLHRRSSASPFRLSPLCSCNLKLRQLMPDSE